MDCKIGCTDLSLIDCCINVFKVIQITKYIVYTHVEIEFEVKINLLSKTQDFIKVDFEKIK